MYVILLTVHIVEVCDTPIALMLDMQLLALLALEVNISILLIESLHLHVVFTLITSLMPLTKLTCMKFCIFCDSVMKLDSKGDLSFLLNIVLALFIGSLKK